MKIVTTLVFASLLLLLAVSCQKEGDTKKDSQAVTADPAQGAIQQGVQGDGEEPVEAKVDGFSAMEEGRGAFGAEELNEVDITGYLTDEQTASLRQTLVSSAPGVGFSIDEQANTMSGNGLPEEGVSIDLLIGKVVKYMALKEIPFDEQMSKRMVEMMLNELSPPPAPEPAAPPAKDTDSNVNTGRAKDSGKQAEGESKQPSAQGPPSQRKYTPELPFAKKIVGDWKSIREEHARISVDHDQAYFELVTLTPEGKAEWQVFVQGERTSRAEYTYTYNERTGKIELHPSDNATTVVMTLYQPEDDQEILYITRDDKKSAIVYERIGEGGYRKPIEEFQGGNLSTGAEDGVKPGK